MFINACTRASCYQPFPRRPYDQNQNDARVEPSRTRAPRVVDRSVQRGQLEILCQCTCRNCFLQRMKERGMLGLCIAEQPCAHPQSHQRDLRRQLKGTCLAKKRFAAINHPVDRLDATLNTRHEGTRKRVDIPLPARKDSSSSNIDLAYVAHLLNTRYGKINVNPLRKHPPTYRI